MLQRKILLLGSTGQIGWELRTCLALHGELVCPTRSGACGCSLDLNDLDGLVHLLDAERPDIIVNAAAYTAVDKAESEPDLAMRMNAEVPAMLGRWGGANQCPIVHYSTDYVFDGKKQAPYCEEDVPNPVSVYGRTKLAGDDALLSSAAAVFILRVSWIYSLRGQNFLKTMQRLMQERDSLKVVSDQVGAPTWSRTVAEATTALIYRLAIDADFARANRGLYHFAPRGKASWYDFAGAIKELGGYDCGLNAIPSDAYETTAKRPANSLMNTSRFENTFGVRTPEWRAALEACLDRRHDMD